MKGYKFEETTWFKVILNFLTKYMHYAYDDNYTFWFDVSKTGMKSVRAEKKRGAKLWNIELVFGSHNKRKEFMKKHNIIAKLRGQSTRVKVSHVS